MNLVFVCLFDVADVAGVAGVDGVHGVLLTTERVFSLGLDLVFVVGTAGANRGVVDPPPPTSHKPQSML